MDTFKRLNSKVNDSNEHFKHKIRIPLNESAFYNVGYNINKKNVGYWAKLGDFECPTKVVCISRVVHAYIYILLATEKEKCSL